jgi:hypothetical protein
MKILNESTNGYIIFIDSDTILKSSKFKFAANLYYEFLVGKYLNFYSRYLPFFNITYDLYIYKSNSAKKEFVKTKDFKNYLKYVDLIPSDKIYDYNYLSYFCDNNTKLCITKEALKLYNNKKLLTIDDYVYEGLSNLTENFYFNLISQLFMVYSTLYILKNNFTHYDLSLNNVLLMDNKEDRYFLVKYKIDDIEFKIRTKYIIKFIDYGDCFINDFTNIKKELCMNRNITCKSSGNYDCGDLSGFNFLRKKDFTKRNFYRNTLLYSNSHDLLMIHHLKDSYRKYFSNSCVPCKKINELCDNLYYISSNGTPPIDEKNIIDNNKNNKNNNNNNNKNNNNNNKNNNNNTIYTITDCYNHLLNFVTSDVYKKWTKKEKYNSMEHISINGHNII